MKPIAARRISFVIQFLLISLIAGCSSNFTPAESTSPPAGPPAGSYDYQFDAANLQPLDASFGQYVLWLRILGDSTDLLAVPMANMHRSNDSLVFSGVVKLPHSPDSILSAIVSIEPSTLTNSPTSPLMTGPFQSVSENSFLSAMNSGGTGNYSFATGSAIFTTKLYDTSKLSDTSRARQEFYLMKFVSGVPRSSISNLPLAPAGWRYGLWVIDSSFYPMHKFFYGSFTNPNGPGSDSSKAEFPFPGGYNPAPLNDPGASLKVTLEPDFSVAGNKPVAPSPLVILWLRLQQFIYFDESIQFQNVWSSNMPTGVLKIWK